MSDLDQELEKAILESEADGEVVAEARPAGGDGDIPARVHPGGGGGASSSGRRNIGLLIGLLVMGAGVLALVFSSFEGAAIYSVKVDELAQNADQYAARNVKVQGELVKGSLKHRAEPCEYRFFIESNGERLPVRYARCVVPDTFRDVPDMDVEVTAEGKMAGEYFEATQIMAKCPSKYEMRDRAAKGEKAPHAMGEYGAGG